MFPFFLWVAMTWRNLNLHGLLTEDAFTEGCFSSPMFFERQFFLLIHIQKFDPPPPNCCQTLPQGIMSMYTTWWCFQLGFNFPGLIIKRFSIIVHYLNPLKKLPLFFLIRSLKSYKLTDRQMRHADKRKAHVSWKNKTVRKIYFIHF